MKRQKVLVQCIVNGEEVAEYVDPRESLLDMLRNHLGLTSVKKGCEVGECGACTVIIDGETIDSCIYLAVWAEGKNIRTLEGLEKTGRSQGSRKHLSKKVQFSAVSVHRDLSCLRLSFWSRAKNSPEMRSAKKCPETSAAVPDIRISSMR